jgi:hypothetical protein
LEHDFSPSTDFFPIIRRASKTADISSFLQSKTKFFIYGFDRWHQEIFSAEFQISEGSISKLKNNQSSDLMEFG